MNKSEDKQRFKKVIELLPEEDVDEFINRQLFNGSYSRRFADILRRYSDYKNKVLSSFSNTRINRRYKKLNESFDILYSFLVHHFFVSDIPNADYLCLEPDRRISPEWSSIKKELDIHAEKFWKSYISFLKVSKKKYDTENKRDIWRETFWSKLGLIIIGSVATLLLQIVYRLLFPN
jgi:hypothetical protein